MAASAPPPAVPASALPVGAEEPGGHARCLGSPPRARGGLGPVCSQSPAAHLAAGRRSTETWERRAPRQVPGSQEEGVTANQRALTLPESQPTCEVGEFSPSSPSPPSFLPLLSLWPDFYLIPMLLRTSQVLGWSPLAPRSPGWGSREEGSRGQGPVRPPPALGPGGSAAADLGPS